MDNSRKIPHNKDNGPRQATPRARRQGLVVREIADEILVYDLERHEACCLNRTAALVWNACDGRKSIGDLGRLLAAETGTPAPEEIVWLALRQLEQKHLLAETITGHGHGSGVSRRALLRRAGLAATIALPVIASMVAPTAAQAASCLEDGAMCTDSAECCVGLECGGMMTCGPIE
ncbi:MAG: PqqD family protein [Blastocatellia bacterium]